MPGGPPGKQGDTGVRYGNLVLIAVFLVPGLAWAGDEGAFRALLGRVFGDAVDLDPAMRAKVLNDTPGKRHYVDRNDDGKPDEVWFIDLDSRHPESMRPVLVRAIDEDADLRTGDEPDLDSDLYVADWKADGTVDAVCDYTDRDGDQDVDEVAFYFLGWTKGQLTVWWGDDVGDENLLWYDVGYTYRQDDCQFRSHFGGSELFSAFLLGPEDKEWVPAFENPFLFYDRDGDGVAEETMRIEGRGDVIKNLRYSFDADNDATTEHPRDYDVSISAHMPDGLALDPALADHRTLRGIPAGGFLSYRAAPEFVLKQTWPQQMLTWDENDLNTDGEAFTEGRLKDPQERWEGIIAKGNEYFKQIGGPSCGTVNKRYEVNSAAKGPIHVYYSPGDQRIHLFGTDHAWILVDMDYDQQPDMRYEPVDSDGDGYLDLTKVDVNMDGTFEDAWSTTVAPQDLPYTFAAVDGVMQPLLARLPSELLALSARLREAAATLSGIEPDAAWRMLESGFDVPALTPDLRVRLLSSNETWRYYLGLSNDRLIAALKTHYAHPEFWREFGGLRGQGDITGLRQLFERAFSLAAPLPDFTEFRARLLKDDRPRVAMAEDWVPPNIGWESEQAAYRAYWGQFDFFGKKKEMLVLPTLTGATPYHAEQDWGMDALHVDNTAGLGGVTLYVNGQAYPVYSPNGKGPIVWSKHRVSETAEQAEAELRAEKVGPEKAPYTVCFRCRALAGRRDSPIEVTVTGGAPGDTIELGIGLRILRQESVALDKDAGILANWGIQEPAIGWVGLGVVYPAGRFLRSVDLPSEHQVVLSCQNGQGLTYHIQATWQKGRRFSRCPVLSNWVGDLKVTAQLAALK